MANTESPSAVHTVLHDPTELNVRVPLATKPVEEEKHPSDEVAASTPASAAAAMRVRESMVCIFE